MKMQMTSERCPFLEVLLLVIKHLFRFLAHFCLFPPHDGVQASDCAIDLSPFYTKGSGRINSSIMARVPVIGRLFWFEYLALFASPVGQTVEAEQVAIAGLDNMLLSLVTEQSAYIYEVGGLCDCGGDPFFFTALAFILRSYK